MIGKEKRSRYDLLKMHHRFLNNFLTVFLNENKILGNIGFKACTI